MAEQERGSFRASLVEAGMWMSIVGAGWLISGNFSEQQLTMSRLGPELWPRAVLLIILVAALGELMAQFRARRLTTRSVTNVAAGTPWHSRQLRIWAGFLAPILWVAVLPRTGFYLATPIFLAAYLVLLGEQRLSQLLLVTAITYGIAIAIFTAILYVPLPVGTWPGFYDFSNWLLTVIR